MAKLDQTKRKQKFADLIKAEGEESDLELDNEIEAMEKINVSKYKKKMELKARLERKNKILEALNTQQQKKKHVSSPKSFKIKSFEDKLLQRIKKRIEEDNELNSGRGPAHTELLNHPSLDNASSINTTLSGRQETLRDQEKESAVEAAKFLKKTGCAH